MDSSGSNGVSNLGVLIAVARQRLTRLLDRQLDGVGLTPHQYWILSQVFRDQALSGQELAGRIHVSPETCSRMVQGLIEGGWVKSTRDPQDRRKQLVRLTASGRRKTAVLVARVGEIRPLAARGISAEQLRTACEVLRQLIANIEELERTRDD
jgi:DNA-binding MarR family transcriptional regulator